MMKKSLIGAAVAASLFALSAPASATLTNWYVDTDGAGGAAATFVNDYLDLTGVAYVHNTFTSSSTFNFKEVGRFSTPTADGPVIGGGTALSPVLDAYFVGTGSGLINGNLSFASGGTLNVKAGATSIADFVLQQGSAVLQANSTLPNGTVSLVFKATNMATGYFFDSGMNDLATVANSSTGLLLGFATTNVISLATAAAIPTTGLVATNLISDYNTAFGTTYAAQLKANDSTDLFLSNNGQFRMQVPEPSMLSLLGLALVGFGFSTRRKNKV